MNRAMERQKDTGRNYGIDLLRIVAMLMIPVLHILGHGGILSMVRPDTMSYRVAWLLEIASYCGVNCYALISGYVGYSSKHKYANVMILYLQVVFYSVVTYVLFYFLKPEIIQNYDLVFSVLPISSKQYWFFTAYFCVALFMPFLNMVLDKLDKMTATKLLITIGGLFVVMPTIFHSDIFDVNEGYSALWLAVLYLVGGSIKKFEIGKKSKTIVCLAGYGVCVVVTWLVKIKHIQIFTEKLFSQTGQSGDFLMGYTSPTILLASIFLLIGFSSLNFKKIAQKIIGFFAPLTFGVYLIHENPIIRRWLISNRFQIYADCAPWILVVVVLGTAIFIWLSGSMIDKVRLIIFKLTRISTLCNWIEKTLKNRIVNIKDIDYGENKKVSVQASIFWNSAGSIVYLLTQWLITILVVRIAGVEAAGDFTLAMSVNNIFYSIAMQGIRNYQVSDVKGKYKDGTYICSRIMACIVSMSVCIGYCLIVGYRAEQKICILVYCLFKMAEAFYDVYAGVCQKNWRMDFVGKSWMLKGVLTFMGFVMILYFTKQLILAIFCMALLSFVIIAFYDVPRTKQLADISMVWKDKNNFLLTKECFPLLCYIILSTTFPTIPRLFLEKEMGSYALGVYGSVATPTLIVQMGATYFFSPFMTLFAEQYSNREGKGFRTNLLKCFLVIGAIGVVGLVGGKILGRRGLNLLYGHEIAEYSSLLIPLLICTILTAFVWMLCGLLTVTRNFKGLLISNGVALIVSFMSSGMLISKFGIQGTSMALGISLMIETIGLFACLVVDMRKQFKQDYKQ